MEAQGNDIKFDIEISAAGYLVEIHRNVTVEILEYEDGRRSIGWKEQPDSIHEYIAREEIDDDNT